MDLYKGRIENYDRRNLSLNQGDLQDYKETHDEELFQRLENELKLENLNRAEPHYRDLRSLYKQLMAEHDKWETTKSLIKESAQIYSEFVGINRLAASIIGLEKLNNKEDYCTPNSNNHKQDNENGKNDEIGHAPSHMPTSFYVSVLSSETIS